MWHRVGKSIYFTHLFTELVKSKDEKTTFTSLLKLNVSELILLIDLLGPSVPPSEKRVPEPT